MAQKIYLSSGFFTRKTRAMVEKVAKKLRGEGYEVYVPMEHEVPDAWNMSEAEWACKVFNADIDAIDDCDMVYLLDFGATGDCGAAWEAGYAYAKKKPVIVCTFGEDMSLMIWAGSADVQHTKKNVKLV